MLLHFTCTACSGICSLDDCWNLTICLSYLSLSLSLFYNPLRLLLLGSSVHLSTATLPLCTRNSKCVSVIVWVEFTLCALTRRSAKCLQSWTSVAHIDFFSLTFSLFHSELTFTLTGSFSFSFSQARWLEQAHAAQAHLVCALSLLAECAFKWMFLLMLQHRRAITSSLCVCVHYDTQSWSCRWHLLSLSPPPRWTIIYWDAIDWSRHWAAAAALGNWAYCDSIRGGRRHQLSECVWSV